MVLSAPRGVEYQLTVSPPVHQNAVEATRQLGLVPPPRGTVGAYELVYEPFGTAFERISELGFGAAIRQTATNSTAFLDRSFNKAHREFKLSVPGAEYLAAIERNPELCGPFRSGLGKLLGEALADGEFSLDRAAAGTARDDKEQDDTGIPLEERASTRKQAKLGRRRRYGLDHVTDRTPHFGTREEKIGVQAVEKIMSLVGKYEPETNVGQELFIDDVVEFLFRAACYMDRHIEIGLRLSNCSKPEKCEAIKRRLFATGGGPFNKSQMAAALIPATIILRLTRGVPIQEAIPVCKIPNGKNEDA